jgi:hypothetical protein
MEWLDNTLVVGDGSLFTVNGVTLELRGEGWERRRRKGDNPGTDRARICRFESEKQARHIAELVATLIEASKP